MSSSGKEKRRSYVLAPDPTKRRTGKSKTRSVLHTCPGSSIFGRGHELVAMLPLGDRLVIIITLSFSVCRCLIAFLNKKLWKTSSLSWPEHRPAKWRLLPTRGSSPELNLLVEVVGTLEQLVHLGLLALQVGAVLLEAAGQGAGALLGRLQVLFHLTEEGLLGLKLGGQGLQGRRGRRRRCGQSSQGRGQCCARCRGLLRGKGLGLCLCISP